MTAKAQGKITMDDVRAALAGDETGSSIDPNATNARKIRDIIGRGSMATIQKHLQTIRAEMAEDESKEPESTDIPAAPAEAVDAIWKAAWLASHSAILERCASLNDDRDRLREALLVATDDGAALTEELSRLETVIEEQSDQIDTQAAAAVQAEEIHTQELAKLTARLDEAHSQNERMEMLIEKALRKS